MRNGFTHSIAALLLLVLLVSGCASMGPGTVGPDRINYDQAVTESWQRQLLMNLVKLRYGDTPFFLDVSSITNSYSLQTQVNMSASWWGNVVGVGAHDNLSLGASGIYNDRPTITYNPLIGQRFTRSLMTPVAPGTVMSLIQAGWPADAVLRTMVTSVNGIQNRFGGGARARGADPEFYRLAKSMRAVQSSGAVGMRIERLKEQEWAVLTLSGAKVPEAVKQDQRAVREILGLRQGADETRIVYGSAPRNDEEIAMVTRSMLEILMDFASNIEVPPAHVEEGLTYGTRVFDTDAEGGFRPYIRIQSGPQRPDKAFVSISYRDRWFWVDDRDFISKNMFSFMLIILSLTDTDPGKGAPIITIPAGG